MVERVRCPHCSTVFTATARPRCPGCGLVGRIPPGTASARQPSRRSTARRVTPRPSRDRVVAAVAVVALLLVAGIVAAIVVDGPETPGATADLTGSDGDGAGDGGDAGDGNQSTPPPNVDLLDPDAPVGGAGPEGPAPAAYTFEGAGDDRTTGFTTEQGLLRVTLHYLGDGYFSATFVDLDDENASRRPLLAPGQGDYRGTRYIGLEPGRYALDVRGDGGAWEVRVEQPRVDAPAAPIQWTGSGDALPSGEDRVFQAEGTVVFHSAHTAPIGEFVVRLYDAHGNLVRRGESEAVVSDYGDHASSVPIALPAAGTYFVDVQAAGDWSVELTR